MSESDEEFLELLRREGPAYRTPPAPPLDAMWERIEQAHFGAASTPLLVTQPGQRGRWNGHWRTWLAAAASVLVGVGIGRATAPPGVVANAPAAERLVAEAGPAPAAPLPQATDAVVQASEGAESVARVRRPFAGRTLASRPIPSMDVSDASDAGVATGGATLAVDAATAPLVADRRGNAYEAATSRYLGQTAALLVSLPAELRAGRADQRFVAQAGDLLTTTRLLLDSDAASNENVRRLLEDLELVLAQISRLPAGRGAADLDLITQALEERDVVPRLRSAAASISTLED